MVPYPGLRGTFVLQPNDHLSPDAQKQQGSGAGDTSTAGGVTAAAVGNSKRPSSPSCVLLLQNACHLFMTASSNSHVNDKAVGVWFDAEALTADVARGKHRRRKKGWRERRVGRIKLSHNLCGATDADDLAALLADDGGKHSSWHNDMASLRGSVGRFVDQDELAADVAASSSSSKFKLQSNTSKPVKIGQTGLVLPSDATMGSFSSQVYPLAEAAVHFPSVDVSPRFTATSAIPHSSSSSTRTLFFPTHIGGVPTWATDMSRLLLGPTTALEGGRYGGNKTCGWHLKPPYNDDMYCLRRLKMMTFTVGGSLSAPT